MNFAPFAILLIYLILIDQSSSASLRKYIKQRWGSVSNIPQESGSSANRVDNGDHGNDENYGQTKRFGFIYSRKRKSVDQDVQAQRQDEKQPKGKRKRGRPRTKTDEYRRNAFRIYNKKWRDKQKKHRSSTALPDDSIEKQKANSYFTNKNRYERERHAKITQKIRQNTATEKEIEARKKKAERLKRYRADNGEKLRQRVRELYKEKKDRIAQNTATEKEIQWLRHKQESEKQYRIDKHEKLLHLRREYEQKNRSKIREIQRIGRMRRKEQKKLKTSQEDNQNETVSTTVEQ